MSGTVNVAKSPKGHSQTLVREGKDLLHLLIYFGKWACYRTTLFIFIVLDQCCSQHRSENLFQWLTVKTGQGAENHP